METTQERELTPKAAARIALLDKVAELNPAYAPKQLGRLTNGELNKVVAGTAKLYTCGECKTVHVK